MCRPCFASRQGLVCVCVRLSRWLCLALLPLCLGIDYKTHALTAGGWFLLLLLFVLLPATPTARDGQKRTAKAAGKTHCAVTDSWSLRSCCSVVPTHICTAVQPPRCSCWVMHVLYNFMRLRHSRSDDFPSRPISFLAHHFSAFPLLPTAF